MYRAHHFNKTITFSLFILAGLIALFSFEGSSAVLAQGGTAFIREVRAFDVDNTGELIPVGLAFSPGANHFLILEAGTPTEIVRITPIEDRLESVAIATGIADPINIAFDGKANRFLLFDSATNELIEIKAKPDGTLDPASLTRHDGQGFGLQSPQGMTIDPDSGALFILDSAGPRIVRVAPDSGQGFGGAVVSQVDLKATGLGTAVRGLAFEPTTGHLHLYSPAQQALIEVTQSGQPVATRDLSEFDLGTPQGLVFAPSGDLTDDSAQLSLYLADSGVGMVQGAGAPQSGQTNQAEHQLYLPLVMGGGSGEQSENEFEVEQKPAKLVELSFVEPVRPFDLAAMASTAALVRTIETWQWSPPSPDPSGIIYLPASDEFLVSDGEVDETTLFTNANLFVMTPTGTLTDIGCTTATEPAPCGANFSDEPTGVGLNPSNGHLFISDDTMSAIHVITDLGLDGRYGTPDDSVTSFPTADFGATDAEGVTFATTLGTLFIVDGLNNEVYQLAPGNNGVFDGASPTGDDVLVGQFDTAGLGMLDPEGIAFNPDTGHLYLAGQTPNIGTRGYDTLLEVTTAGVLVQTIDVSAANPGNIHSKQKLSGLAYAPSSVVSGAMNIYIADRGQDNFTDPHENDGRVFEMTLPVSGPVPPEANDDSADTTENLSVTIDVAANDIDLNGNLDPNSANSSCTNGSLGCNGVTNGSLTDNGDGTITYTPNPGYTGSDSFVYEICDTDSLCSTATVSITVSVNVPPVA
ncbi:MAG: Ig-like domain-containing protein, partial [Anaerolineae bacterium]|nr:Ig-like domain-containing protein [Anaerolineae bacterium]